MAKLTYAQRTDLKNLSDPKHHIRRRSVNPLVPLEQQETNLLWLRRELADVRQAMDRLEQSIK